MSLESSLPILQQTLFAVKTHTGNHASRLPILQETWLTVPYHTTLVSDSSDSRFGTAVLPGAGINTPFGHCSKSISILKHFHSNAEKKNWKWIVIADDDTVLSVAKLVELLSCYSAFKDEPLALGERWGYRVSMLKGRRGQDYLAGGGGIVLSYHLVERILDPANPFCKCPEPTAYDDVHLVRIFLSFSLHFY
jgi:UDP-glucose:O-linked fucose beta-1,3-glucosyltransferase